MIVIGAFEDATVKPLVTDGLENVQLPKGALLTKKRLSEIESPAVTVVPDLVDWGESPLQPDPVRFQFTAVITTFVELFTSAP
ncbi:MAG: hypothetical protein L3K23_02255 [Thermoplasmata archaeon]|nr:hypothetical protein [Thermoplasmata archaeon]